MSKDIEVGSFAICIDDDGVASISSDCKEECPNCGMIDCISDCPNSDDTRDYDAISREMYNSAIDGIESLLLAMAVEGVLTKENEDSFELWFFRL